MDSIIAAITEWLADCPELHGLWLNVDYLPADAPDNGIEMSVDTEPGGGPQRIYTDGSSLNRLLFTLRTIRPYSPGMLQNLQNSSLFEKIDRWMQTQARAGAMPVLGEGCRAVAVTALGHGYPALIGVDAAQYQIACALDYYQPYRSG